MARPGWAKPGQARHREAGQARLGLAGRGRAWHGRAGEARQGRAWLGLARRGAARLGSAGHGEARRGRRGTARLGVGKAWRGKAWHGEAGKAGHGEARRGMAWQAWRGAAWQGRAGRDKAGMTHYIVGHPQVGKPKSKMIIEAFCAGAGKPRKHTAVFFGCVGLEQVFRSSMESPNIDVLYGDNSYTDRHRGTHFRFTLNALQPTALQPPDHARARALGVKVRDWQRGKHVVIVEQSEHFLTLSGAGADWLERTVEKVRAATDRPLHIRRWSRDKEKAARGLAEDLKGAHALVTAASAAAVEALLAGVPVFVTGQSAAAPMASGAVEAIESPRYPDGREEWAAGLANSQWTIEELREGAAWRRLVEGMVQDSGASA